MKKEGAVRINRSSLLNALSGFDSIAKATRPTTQVQPFSPKVGQWQGRAPRKSLGQIKGG